VEFVLEKGRGFAIGQMAEEIETWCCVRIELRRIRDNVLQGFVNRIEDRVRPDFPVVAAAMPRQSYTAVTLVETSLLADDNRCSQIIGPEVEGLHERAPFDAEQEILSQNSLIIDLGASFRSHGILTLTGLLLYQFVRNEVADFALPDGKPKPVPV